MSTCHHYEEMVIGRSSVKEGFVKENTTISTSFANGWQASEEVTRVWALGILNVTLSERKKSKNMELWRGCQGMGGTWRVCEKSTISKLYKK